MKTGIAALDECRIISFPKIEDVRGNLTFVESHNHIPFEMQRVYWLYDVPGGHTRVGHAYHTLEEVLVAVSGSFDVTVSDGVDERTFSLNRSYYGLYVPPLIWRAINNFSTNSLCVVMASRPFDESDYIRDSAQYQALRAERDG